MTELQDPSTTVIQNWVDGIQAGDPDAGNDLLATVQDRLLAMTRRMLRRFPKVGRRVEAEDVFQDACLRLLGALRDVRPADRREFYGLAALQVRRVLLDLARHYRSPVTSPQSPPDQSESAGPWEPPAPVVDDLERWTRFHLAVETLPADEREVVGLRLYHGLPEAEIAELLRVCVRTVQRAWKRAMQRLQGLVDGRK